MKVFQWALSIGIGFFFGWLTLKDGHFQEVFGGTITWQDGYLLSGRSEPLAVLDVHEGMPLIDSGWQLNLVHYLGYFIALAAIHVLRVIRWGPLIQHLVKLPFRRLNAISAVGFMGIFLLPLRLGEFVRPYLVHKEVPEVSMSALVGTVVIERVFDGLIVTLLLFVALSSASGDLERFNAVTLGAWLSLAVFVAGLATLILLHNFKDYFYRKLHLLLRPLPIKVSHRVIGMMDGFSAGLSTIPNRNVMVSFSLTTLLYWCLNGFAIWAVAPGFGLNIELSTGFMMMSCVVVGMMIPNSPGNVGTFWYFLLLPLAGIEGLDGSAQITILGLGLYLAQLVQQSSFGLWFLMTNAFSRTSLEEAASYASSDSEFS